MPLVNQAAVHFVWIMVLPLPFFYWTGLTFPPFALGMGQITSSFAYVLKTRTMK